MKLGFALVVLGVLGCILGTYGYLFDPGGPPGHAGVTLVHNVIFPLLKLSLYGGSVLLLGGIAVLYGQARR